MAETGELAVSTHPDGDGWASPALLPAPGGLGAPELVVTTHPVLFVRNDAGTVSTAHTTPEGYTTWVQLDGKVLDHPAATVTSNGSIVLTALGSAGNLLVNREQGGAFSGWKAVG